MLYFLVAILLSASSCLTAEENLSNEYLLSEEFTVTKKSKIAIVIDDLGDNSIIAKKMLALPSRLTVAILPKTPHANFISRLASDYGHEIIMHLPMEAFSRPDLLGPEALLSTMDHTTFSDTFNQNFLSIPNVIGFNNHMGSLLTEDREKMKWLMRIAKSKSVFFLDSKTSHSSIAENIAKEYGVPSISRDIFLDHKDKNNSRYVQLEKTKAIAKKIGKAVLICHPYPETLSFLKTNIALLDEEFELVGLSELLEEKFTGGIQPSLAR